MPEKMIYDFGDMVLLLLTDESEKDLSKVTVQDDIFESMTKGYLSCTKNFLTTEEKESFYTEVVQKYN